jgi:hypothetical protein
LPKKIFFIADTRCRARYVRIRSDKANKVKAEREVRQWIYDITRKAIPDSLNVTFFALSSAPLDLCILRTIDAEGV